MKLSLYEQESIILYNQAEATAEVYTHDSRLLEKLRRIQPQFTSVKHNVVGHICYGFDHFLVQFINHLLFLCYDFDFR